MKDLTQGPVIGHLLGMTAFMLVGLSVSTLYSLVDLYWVGSLGPQAVAAVTVSSNLMFVSLAVSQMLGVGTGALIAQAVGAKNHEAAHHVFNQALAMSIVAMLVFAAPALAAERAFSSAFGADAETGRLTSEYLRWFVPGMALGFPVMVMSAALRGTGSMLPGTIAQVGSVMLNMVLAPVLIFGWLGLPALGVEGAGLATLISVAVCLLGLWLYFLRPQTFVKLRLGDWAPQRAVWLRVLKIGVPSALEFALMAAYMFFITAVLRPYGATEQAAFGIGQRLLQASMLPVMALSFASAAVVGQNYGAKFPDRVRESFVATLKIGLACMIPLCLLAEAIPTSLIGIFSNDPAVIEAGTLFLRIISLNLLSMALTFAVFGLLSGLGNTIPTLISSSTRIGLIVISTLLLIRAGNFQVAWLWWMSVLGTAVQMLMNLWFLRRELRRRLGTVAGKLAPAMEQSS